MKIYYNPKLKQLARNLRNNSTLSEVLFWNELKQHKLGYKFLRQKPIGDFIVDFYFSKLRLAIEVDGDSHGYTSAEIQDERKEKYLISLDIKLVRYDDQDVKDDIDAVINHLLKIIELERL